MNSSLLKDRVAIVTGSGKGIGRAIALSLAKEGAKVVTNSRRPGTAGGDAEGTARKIEEIGGQAVAHYGDVSDFEQARKLIQTVLDNFGSIHILVNNAGVFGGKVAPWEMSETEWDRIISIHLKGTFNCTRHVCGIMKKQGSGRIINCTSGAWIGRSGGCHYAAAKAGIVGFTQAIARQMGGCGVTSNAYHPYAKTKMLGRDAFFMIEERFRLGEIDKEEYEWQLNPPSPDAVGPLITYLCSDESGSITGKVFYVSGGKIAIYSEPERKQMIIKREGYWTINELREEMPRLINANQIDKPSAE